MHVTEDHHSFDIQWKNKDVSTCSAVIIQAFSINVSVYRVQKAEACYTSTTGCLNQKAQCKRSVTELSRNKVFDQKERRKEGKKDKNNFAFFTSSRSKIPGRCLYKLTNLQVGIIRFNHVIYPMRRPFLNRPNPTYSTRYPR